MVDGKKKKSPYPTLVRIYIFCNVILHVHTQVNPESKCISRKLNNSELSVRGILKKNIVLELFT
jgi:hypothetical protein